MPAVYKMLTMDLIDVDEAVSSLSVNTTASLIQPFMYILSSAFLLGSLALQSVLGRPADKIQVRQSGVEDFIKSESPIAIEQLLCNIGSEGCHAKNVPAGIVIASPDTQDPDCEFRDPTCMTSTNNCQTFIPGLEMLLLSSSILSTGSCTSTTLGSRSASRSTLHLKPSFRASPTLLDPSRMALALVKPSSMST